MTTECLKCQKKLSELFSSTELSVDQRLPKFKANNIYDAERTDTGAHKMKGGAKGRQSGNSFQEMISS